MKQTVYATVDIHEEQSPAVISAVEEHPEIEDHSFGVLSAGDLEIAGIGFERKTPSDLITSLEKGRLDEQLEKLSQRYEHAYLLYEGDIHDTEGTAHSAMNGASVRGLLASLTVREDSGVNAAYPCSNAVLLVDMAVRIARKHVEDSERSFVPTPDVGIDAPTTLMMYACIDGVGPDTAETLHEEYPTIRELIENADAESLESLNGIGPKTAERIMEDIS